MMNSTKHAEEVLGNKLTFVQDGYGTTYVPLKRLCESLGIDYERQRSKARNGKQPKAKLMPVTGTDGRHRNMPCLPLAEIGDWASAIDPNTVPPEVLEELRGYLEEPDEVSQVPEDQGASADPGMAEITSDEDRKERVYNCLGNLNWFLDAFLLWAREMADNDGDYFPGDETAKATPEEVRKFVRKVRCNIRVLQAIIDASIEYENVDDPLAEHELIEFYNESLKLYLSTDKLIQPFDGDGSGARKSEHTYMDYLCGLALDAMTELGGEIIMNFHERIIPRKREGWREIELLQTIADRLFKRMDANTKADDGRQALESNSPSRTV